MKQNEHTICKNELLTPTELLKKYECDDLTAHQIGHLLSCDVVKGFKLSKGCVVYEQSFLRLLEYRNKVRGKSMTVSF